MNFFKNYLNGLSLKLKSVHPLATFVLVALLLCFTALSRADIALTPLPPYLAETKGTPMVMLNMSRDHQLFYKAYNEYSDLDNDGTVDTQYKHSYKYYGYFDNKRCYDYDTTNNRFVPVSLVDGTGYCTLKWNGNFLNWSTMTRMDVVRRILYGGMRSTDQGSPTTAPLTVLERAHLPTDAHAFAKYYYGNDINKLTPFNPLATTFTVNSGTSVVSTTAAEITICNASYRNGTVEYSHQAISPPTIRVAKGNFALWNSNERWQCYWSDEKTASNDNNPAVSGINAAAGNPTIALHALGTGRAAGDYTARVQVCKTGLPNADQIPYTTGFTDDEEGRCKLYPVGNYKPVGLLQRYGERGEAAFGLITGSYDKNISGGVLRKNISTFTNEVDLDDGQFTNTSGIVKTLNSLRIYGYKYTDGTYLDNDQCDFQTIGLTEGRCSSWGNPMGEMYLEALRYFAGKSATTAFNAATPTKDIAIGLPTPVWSDPFASTTVASFGARECRRSSIINFNASVTSYDSDQWTGASDINTLTAASVKTQTNYISDAEGISATGKTWSVGNNGVTGAGSNNLCTNKTISSLADSKGVCPESPTYGGSFLVSGAAMYAHMNQIRTDISVPTSNTSAFRVNTYSVALATGSPRIVVPVPNKPGKTVVIQPAYRLAVGTGGGGTLVDFKVVVQTPTYGKYVLQWEDSEQGGDYDQDLWGTLEYTVVGDKIRVSTFVQAESTGNPQGMGYVIAGTDGKDGAHFHSGIENFTFNDSSNISVTPTTNLNATGGCQNCNVGNIKTTAEYTMVGTPSEVLRDPFWYAAKYGGFDRDLVGGYVPGSVLPPIAWDSKGAGGLSGSDGIPDNYFYAVDPGELEKSLASVFQSILKAGGAAPAAATSSRTQAGGYVYVSTHSIKGASTTEDANASGEFLKYGFEANGSVAAAPEWDAGLKLTTQNWDTGRQIFSMNDVGTPIAFRWANLSSGQQAALKATGTTALGQNRLNWLRGDGTNETTLGTLRKRPTTKLGSIVNSSPWYIGQPSAGYTVADYGGGYTSFRSGNTATNAVFVAANDGMLHAFDGNTGKELFGYVPRALYSKLKNISDKDYALNSTIDKVNADGSIMVADMKIGGTATGVWSSYLFGSMGRGAKGVYALNVTKPQLALESSSTVVSNLVRWEFTNANDSDFGHVLGRSNAQTNGQPYQTGYMANGKWAAIYGNGYNSLNGKAALFILYADKASGTTTWSASEYKKIIVDAGTDNGLSAPTALDSDNDGVIDTIYAGDLKGRVWKFDVRDVNPTNWKVASKDASNNAVPLYEAKTTISGSTTIQVQPITTAIQPFPHPKGGFLLVAATGKFLESNDYPQSVQFKNTVYGLHDSPLNTTTITVGTSTLVEQTITFVNGIRYMSKNNVDYTTKKGWYFDLPVASEGIGFNPLYEDVRRVSLKSIAPEAASNGCRRDSYGFDMALDPISGTPIANLIPGATLVNGAGAIGGSTLNSFEYARGGVYPRSTTPPPTCDAATSGINCKCDPANPTNCRLCEPGKPCCVPWDPDSCSTNQCTFRTLSALGSGGIDSFERFGKCNDGRLTWREVLRIN